MTRASARRTPSARRHLRCHGASYAHNNVLKPWQQEAWCRPSVSAEGVWHMEALLALDAEPSAPPYPVVCCDASPSPLVSEVRQPWPVRPGQPARYDDAYRREGTCPLVLGFDPLQGGRHVNVTARRTTQDWAHGRQDLVEVHGPPAPVIRVVLDNLHTQTPAAL